MEDKKFLGVCLWVSNKLNLDVSIVRVLWIFFSLFGAGILAYFIIFLLLEFKIVE